MSSTFTAVPPPGWGGTAVWSAFYASAPWCRFADSDGVALPSYGVAEVGGREVAWLAAHRSPEENNPGYVLAEALDIPVSQPLILGGRRGYASRVLVADREGDGEALAGLVRAAAGDEPWWWPYLSAPDAAYLASVMAPEPVRIDLIEVSAHLAAAGGINEHIARLPSSQRRTNARRERRAFTEAGFTVEQADLTEHLSEAGELLSQLQVRHGQNHDSAMMTELLQRQADHLGAHAVFEVCRLAGAVVGFWLAYEWGDTLYLRVIGMATELAGRDGLYAELAVYRPLQHCARRGLSTLDLGGGSLDAKCRRGAELRPLYSVRGGGDLLPGRVDAMSLGSASLPERERSALLTDLDADTDTLRALPTAPGPGSVSAPVPPGS